MTIKDLSLEDLIESAGEGQINVIASIDPGMKQPLEYQIAPENVIGVLPVRSTTLFPDVMLPITVSRTSSLQLLRNANKNDEPIAVFAQLDDSVDEPEEEHLYRTGVIAKVTKILTLPGGHNTALLQGYRRVKLIQAWNNNHHLEGHIEDYPDFIAEGDKKEIKALVAACKETCSALMKTNPSLFGAAITMNQLADTVELINFACTNMPFLNSERMSLLEESDIAKRGFMLLNKLNKELQFATLKMNLQRKTKETLDKQQRDYFLRQEIENIQNELGERSNHNDLDELRTKASKKQWNEQTAELFEHILSKLERLSTQSPDYQVEYQYAVTMLELPWNEYTKDNLNLKNAERVLNKDHYGMEKVKERILEHLAVLALRDDFKSPILCLYGPPGVGKTSLGRSIAKAMKREYVRISLGGLHDESEIRGHRRTYVGAMPGRIIKGMQKAKSSNPVFILDEIDKVAQHSGHGDPSSALLEVLDPEQNIAFHDNYLDCDYDLSKVMFIATANNISTIPSALLDRMELIEVSGYLTEEKIEIAKRHLIPNQQDNLGMKELGVKVSKQAIEYIIEKYTRESGVRSLDKKIGSMLRKIALEYARTESTPDHDIKIADVKKYLGTEPYSRDIYQGNDYAGVVTGLAWTAVGGEILFIETSLSRGKGGKLTLTGNLGDVMKESAMLAVEYLKAHSQLLGIDYEIFDNWNIHIHVPEGAVPKDGPSAGITIATSIASALTQRKVRKNLAMTGEITLRGKVLPVGGIKEKILAAKRAGITDIMLCHENRKNIEEIPEIYVKGLTFHYVECVSDVLEFALLDEKVKHAIDLTVKKEEDK